MRRPECPGRNGRSSATHRPHRYRRVRGRQALPPGFPGPGCRRAPATRRSAARYPGSRQRAPARRRRDKSHRRQRPGVSSNAPAPQSEPSESVMMAKRADSHPTRRCPLRTPPRDRISPLVQVNAHRLLAQHPEKVPKQMQRGRHQYALLAALQRRQHLRHCKAPGGSDSAAGRPRVSGSTVSAIGSGDGTRGTAPR